MNDVVEKTGVTLTKEQKKKLKSAFKTMDLNHDGRLSKTELKRACKHIGILVTDREVNDLCKQMDKDGNGYVEFKEYEDFIGSQLVIANYKNKFLEDEFRKFDVDGDGFITGEEIRRFFKDSGVDLTDAEVEELIQEADENGDGVISFEEFVNSVCEKDW